MCTVITIQYCIVYESLLNNYVTGSLHYMRNCLLVNLFICKSLAEGKYEISQ